MDLKALLQAVRDGSLALEEAEQRLARLPFEDQGFARIDHHRRTRIGFPEVIYCEGKTPEQAAQIFERLASENPNVLATRASAEQALAIAGRVPGTEHDELGRCIRLFRDRQIRGAGRVLVVTAGTADLPVAREALFTAEVMGNECQLVTDVGVAGIHRLLAESQALREAAVVIVVAGMEGALPSVVGGLVAVPVIGVPTSVGYGTSFAGVAALLGMLNSCASGLLVVNIDNGFGAAFAASKMNRRRAGPDD